MPELITRASASLSSFNAEARTVDAVLATETPVRRRSWQEGDFDEILICTPAAIDTARLESMALLDSHNAYGLNARLGSVLPGSLRFERGAAIVTIKLSRNEKGEAVFRDLEDGHKLSLSVGYSIDKEERTTAPAGGVATVKAVRWTPHELSVVAIPADPAASTRSFQKEDSMPQTQTQQTNDVDIRAERARVNEICALARTAKVGVGEEIVTKAIADGQTIEQFRAALLDFKIAQEERSPTFPHIETRGMQDSQETARRLATSALLHRTGITDKLEDGANQYRGMTTIELARDLFAQRGESTRGTASEIAQRSLHSSTDFSIILGEVTRATLLTAYQASRNTFQLFANHVIVPDLREVRVVELGNGPGLEALTEKGEYKRGTFKESEESFSLGHWGKTVGFTEHMLINDSLGAFSRAIAGWGAQAARLEGDIAWAPILKNAKLKSDNLTLFHNTHGNLAAAGTALDETNLVAARAAFRRQTDIDGQRIALTPHFVCVGTDLEITAQKLTQAQFSPATMHDSIPQAIREMVAIYEPRIDSVSSKAWFVFASQAETMGRGLQYAHLAGYETPRLKSREGFDFDGVEYRLDHYFGAGLTDYRFAYKNAGL